MIDPQTDYIYNIILSIALGVIIVLIFNLLLFNSPQIIKIKKQKQ